MTSPATIDAADLRRAFSGFPSGVAALAAIVDGDPTVLIASSFTVGVSQDPPLVLVAIQHSSTTWPVLASAATIGISVLGEDHVDTARQLAGKDKSSRFAGVPVTVTSDDALLLDGSPVRLECTIEHVYPAGDHDIVVLRVRSLEADFAHRPLIWHRSSLTALPASDQRAIA